MGLSSTGNRKSYTGDGSSTIFSFPYEFFSASDLQVYLYDTNSSVIAAQQLNTHFTVSGAQNNQGIYPNGGNVVMNSAFPASQQIVITRSPIQTNNYVLNQNSPINSLALVQQLDYLTALVQRLQDLTARTVQIPDGLGLQQNSSFGVVLPSTIFTASSALKAVVVNSGATGIDIAAIPGLTIPFPVNQGGTGLVAFTTNAVFYASAPTTMSQLAVGGQDQVLVGQAGAAPTWGPVNLASGSSTVNALPATSGGTGITSITPQYGVMYAASASQLGVVASAASGLPLLAQGSSAPIFQALALTSGVSGILPVGNGGTGTGTSYIQYGLIYASSATQLGTVPSAALSNILAANGSSAPSFKPIGFVMSSVFTAQGQILVGTGNNGYDTLNRGTDNYYLISDSSQVKGVRWAPNPNGASTVPTVTVLNSSGTYTPPGGTVWISVEVVGGGGGGGGAGSGASTSAAGGGGGAGGYAKKLIIGSGSLQASYIYRVGDAGAGGSTGNNGGGTGGTTVWASSVVGATISCIGGGAGGGGSASSSVGISGNAGAGGAASGGDKNVNGSAGEVGIVLAASGGTAISGRGGTNPLGIGGAMLGGTGQNGTGAAGTGYGAGGSGGLDCNNAGAAAGGAGAKGVIVIEEHYNY